MAKWTLEILQTEALKYKTKKEFYKNSNRAYKAALYNKILDQICSHMPKHSFAGENNPAFKWTLEELQQEALKYKTRGEFRNKNRKAYGRALKRNILEKISAHMPRDVKIGKKPPTFKWSENAIIREALKYKTRNEFQKNSRGAYKAAQKMGILDKICSHMPKHVDRLGKNNPNYRWTDEKLQAEALKYSTRGEFENDNYNAYTVALNRKILDQICSHMLPATNTSVSEKHLFNIIKSIYPKTQKLRDSKVKIDSKPQIKGFDIDIYIPELRKGIEFDGRYYHSFQGLKRGRPNWSDEDINSYHELKDSWFASKGIKILHIKEEDWLVNEQTCVDKCLEFFKN